VRENLLVAGLLVALVAAGTATSAEAATPKISGSDRTVWNIASPTPSYTITGSKRGVKLTWSLSGTRRTGSGKSPLTVTLPGLATGRYTLSATQPPDSEAAKRRVTVDVTPPTVSIRRPTAGALYAPGQAVQADYSCGGGAVSCTGPVRDGAALPTGSPGPATFTVSARDGAGNTASKTVAYTVGPAAPTIVGRPAGPVRGGRPVFSWTGGQPGAVFTWQVLSGGAVVSAGDTPVTSISLGPLEPGSYAFQVRQTGPRGRSGPFSAAEPFTVIEAVRPTRQVPPTLTPGRLHPPAGASTTAARPLLSWRRVRGARLYNLQVFRIHGSHVTQVVSTFPRGTRARVSGLRYGNRYAWRVWPYLKTRSYAREPVGLSWFDMVRPVRVDRAQMLVNRRIAQAAVRRVDAIEAWLDAGIAAGDIRHEGLGSAVFDPALRPTGPPAGSGTAAASVRPIGTGAGRLARGPVPVGAREMLHTQRISQAAVRHVAALEARLASGLTGGDVADGSIGLTKLAPGVRLGALGAGTPVAASVTRIAAPAHRRHRAVRPTRGQLLINQRIAQGAMRRAAALRTRLLWGLSSADFRPGSIGLADLDVPHRL
jgi:hypothetical protein